MLRSASIVSGMTFLSRIAGFVRDVVLARFFGAGAGMDVFVVSFQIPNFLRRLFAEGAFAPAFVPVLAQYHETGDEEGERAFISRAAGTLGGVLLLVTVAGMVAAPLLILLFSSGFTGNGEADRFGLAVDMLRLTFPYIAFISLTALAGAVLNMHGRFAVPAFTPVLLNVVLILAAIFISPRLPRPEMGLAIGVLLAGAAQLAFQVPFLRQLHRLPLPRWGWRDPGVQRVMQLMLPAIFGSSVAQLNLLIDRHIASYLETGSISWLYYADRLLEFPLGVFAVALATVILPRLSLRHSADARDSFTATLDWALQVTALIALPAAAGLLMLTVPLMSTLFLYGEFDARDATFAGYALMAYAVSLPAFIAVKVLAPGYYARQDTGTPVRIGIIAMAVNIVLNAALVWGMLHFGFVAPHAGLAAATGTAAVVNAGLLLSGLLRAGVYRPGASWAWLLPRVLLATLLMGMLIHWLAGERDFWLTASVLDRAIRLGVCVFSGMGAYALVLVICGIRPRHLKAPV